MKEASIKRMLIGVIVFYLLICGLLTTYAMNPQQIVQNTFPSVVLLLLEDSNRQPLTLASGFFVEKDIVATNFHVIEGAHSGYAKIVGQDQKYDIIGIVASDRKKDLALLKIQGVSAPPLVIGDSELVSIGSKIYVAGNPLGLEGTFSEGIISGIRQFDEGNLLQITAPISPGSSGGPVLNTNGEVIGVSVATFRGGQNLNFAVPAYYLKPLIADIGEVTSLTSETEKEESIISSVSDQKVDEAINIIQVVWKENRPIYSSSGTYSFSLQNTLRHSIKNISGLIIFYDEANNPIEVDFITYNGVIPAGLSRRMESRVHASIQRITTGERGLYPQTKIEFRTLHFEIVE